MKIAIIGGGFTGLTAAYELGKCGHSVTVFEKDKTLGGLAYGFRKKGWGWHLEAAYHHLFTSDHAILGLIKELGLADKIIIKRPITATLWNNTMYPFDTPVHLLRFPGLLMIDRLRTGLLLAALKLNPFWQPFEWLTAKQLFLTIGGTRAWEAIWEPLMIGKFGPYADRVAASWLWARIKKRTPKLCYIEGGFHTLVTALKKAIIKHGGSIRTGTNVVSIKNHWVFDRTLLTIPTPIANKLVPHLALNIPHLHAQTLILETKEPILKDVYWLNITDRSFPFLAVVAHTNMIDKKHYGGRHITYFGNYLPDGHPYLSLIKEQLLKIFLPYIKRLNPSFDSSFIIHHFSYIGFYAQPVHELRYSERAPKLATPIPGLYLANMDSIYPWDRGTNYAVELGKRAAAAIA